jgi:transketolase C-terminal domain/subunit
MNVVIFLADVCNVTELLNDSCEHIEEFVQRYVREGNKEQRARNKEQGLSILGKVEIFLKAPCFCYFEQ